MITWIVSSTTLILIVILLRQIFRKKISHALQYALWLPVLLRLLIPVTPIASDFSIMNLLPEPGKINLVEEFDYATGDDKATHELIADIGADESAHVEINDNEQVAQTNPDPGQTENVQMNGEKIFTQSAREPDLPKVTFADVAVIVWALGSLIMAAVLIGSNVTFYLRLKKERVPFESEQSGEWQRKCKLPVFMAENLTSPCLFGILSPAIYVTPKIHSESVCTEHVIFHEICHYKRGDHIWSLLRGLCLAVWWWNPLVWAVAKMSVQDGELACDEVVIRLIGEESRLDYGHTLVNMIPVRQRGSNILCCATSMGTSKKSIKERLQSITSKQKNMIGAVVIVLCLLTLALAVTLTGAGDKESVGVASKAEESETVESSTETTEDDSSARELTKEEKEELFAYIAENYAEDASLKMYDSVSPPEFEVLPVDDWDLSGTEEEVIAVIMMEQVVFWSNESYSLGPQWGSGLWKTRFYIGERDGKPEVVDFSIPMDINDVPRPSEVNADEETLALIEKLGITHSQYRDLSHQMEGLLVAKVDHDFDSYLDLTQEEYNRYINVRKNYFFYPKEWIDTIDLSFIHRYDWGNRNYNYDDEGTPEFVNQEVELYNCEEKVDTSKDNLTATTVDIYLIGEHVIGQQVRITDESTGKVTEMEYQFMYIPQQEEWPDSSRMFIIGGRVLLITQ